MGKLTKAVQAKQVEMRLRGFILNRVECTPPTVLAKVNEFLGRPLSKNVVIETYGYDYGDSTPRGMKVMCHQRRGSCMSFQFFGTEKIGEENFDCGKFVEKCLKIEVKADELAAHREASEKKALQRANAIGDMQREIFEMYKGILRPEHIRAFWDGEKTKSLELNDLEDEQLFKLAAYYAQLKREQKLNETTTHQG